MIKRERPYLSWQEAVRSNSFFEKSINAQNLPVSQIRTKYLSGRFPLSTLSSWSRSIIWSHSLHAFSFQRKTSQSRNNYRNIQWTPWLHRCFADQQYDSSSSYFFYEEYSFTNQKSVSLFEDELIYLRRKQVQKQILRKAEIVYRTVVERTDPFLSQFCCDFETLERLSMQYRIQELMHFYHASIIPLPSFPEKMVLCQVFGQLKFQFLLKPKNFLPLSIDYGTRALRTLLFGSSFF